MASKSVEKAKALKLPPPNPAQGDEGDFKSKVSAMAVSAQAIITRLNSIPAFTYHQCTKDPAKLAKYRRYLAQLRRQLQELDHANRMLDSLLVALQGGYRPAETDQQSKPSERQKAAAR